jgi:hypothetical protein
MKTYHATNMSTDTLRKYEIRSIDAWRDFDGWQWNASYGIESDVFIADSVVDSPRKLLKACRDTFGLLTDSSKGHMRVDNYDGSVVEIQNRNTYEPLFAFITNL